MQLRTYIELHNNSGARVDQPSRLPEYFIDFYFNDRCLAASNLRIAYRFMDRLNYSYVDPVSYLRNKASDSVVGGPKIFIGSLFLTLLALNLPQ